MFSESNTITKSINARFKNYKMLVKDVDWDCPKNSPIVAINPGARSSIAENFVLFRRKSTRGRKPILREKKKKFASSTTFVIRKPRHREPIHDELAQTSSFCLEHKNCEIVYKDYNVLIFNGGKIVCVGVREEECSDFVWCMKIIVDYMEEQGLDRRDLDVLDIKITLENFGFHLCDPELGINLYELNNYFTEKFTNSDIINVDIFSIYELFSDLILSDCLEFSTETITTNFVGNSERKHFLINKDVFSKFLQAVKLEEIKKNCEILFGYISISRTDILTEFSEKNLHQNLIFCFVKIYCEDLLGKLNTVKHEIVETIQFNEEKNTLMLKKKFQGKIITIKIFSSGKIVVVGSKKNREIDIIRDELSLIFTHPKILYKADCFEMIKFEDVFLSFDESKN